MTTRRRRVDGGNRRKHKPRKPAEVLVDEETPTIGGEPPAPLTVAVLLQRQHALLEQLPVETRRRLRYLSKHWDIPELAAMRMAIADSYQTALDDEP